MAWPEAYEGKNFELIQRILKFKGGVRIATMVGDETWNLSNAQLAFLDAGGSSRNIDLEEEENEGAGLWRLVVNTGGEDLVMRNDAAATIITISPNEMGFVACNGAVWDGFIITGALS